MATVRDSLGHEQRTAQEPRESRIEPVILSRVENVNKTIRLLRLSSVDPNHTLKFLPGQWLDTFIPDLPKAGGFTITSTPRDARPTPERAGYLELAIQQSQNPPAKWLWRPQEEILGSKILVRVGGSFVWPPPKLDVNGIHQVLLVAGGVGINPLISILSHLLQQPRRPSSIRFVYTTKVEPGPVDGNHILFLDRLMGLVEAAKHQGVNLDLYLTGTSENEVRNGKALPSNVKVGRIGPAEMDAALGHDITGRESTVAYVCGPPHMTDLFVAFLSSRKGMSPSRVLCEKWW